MLDSFEMDSYLNKQKNTCKPDQVLPAGWVMWTPVTKLFHGLSKKSKPPS